jgi:hypothetical protein
MDGVALAETLQAVALAIALAACAGLRTFLPLFLAGLLSRAGWLVLGPSFQFLSSNRALILFGIASLIEILADKIPAVDHALDALSTPLRAGAGALLAASALGQVTDPLHALALGAAVGAPAALVPHAAKAGLRAASTAFTGGLANPLLSFGEDVVTLLLFALAVLVPLAVVLLLVLVLAGVLLGRRLLARPAVPGA